MTGTMNELWMKPFTFRANRFEEWTNGQCLRQGNVDLKIAAIPYPGIMRFQIEGNISLIFPKTFDLSLADLDTALLSDRIQYGGLHSSRSRYPLVCNIFNNRQCIRFGFWDVQLHIIEFYGDIINILR